MARKRPQPSLARHRSLRKLRGVERGRRDRQMDREGGGSARRRHSSSELERDRDTERETGTETKDRETQRHKKRQRQRQRQRQRPGQGQRESDRLGGAGRLSLCFLCIRAPACTHATHESQACCVCRGGERIGERGREGGFIRFWGRRRGKRSVFGIESARGAIHKVEWRST